MPLAKSSNGHRVHSEQVSLEVALLASASPAEANPLVVLVVASDADVRAYVTDALRQNVFDVVATGSVPSALDAAARCTPRMLVVAHPERAVLRHLPAVPAVLLSDDDSTADVKDPRRLAPLVLLRGSFRIQRLLEATNSISQLEEFVAATFACWEQRVPFGTYNVTNPGQVTTREVVGLIKKSGVSTKDFEFFTDEAEFMRTAAKTPRSNCVMSSAKLAATGIRLTEVHDAVERDLRRWVKA